MEPTMNKDVADYIERWMFGFDPVAMGWHWRLNEQVGFAEGAD